MLDLEFGVMIDAASRGGNGTSYQIPISLVIHSTFRRRQTDLKRQRPLPYGVLQRLSFLRTRHIHGPKEVLDA